MEGSEVIADTIIHVFGETLEIPDNVDPNAETQAQHVLSAPLSEDEEIVEEEVPINAQQTHVTELHHVTNCDSHIELDSACGDSNNLLSSEGNCDEGTPKHCNHTVVPEAGTPTFETIHQHLFDVSQDIESLQNVQSVHPESTHVEQSQIGDKKRVQDDIKLSITDNREFSVEQSSSELQHSTWDKGGKAGSTIDKIEDVVEEKISKLKIEFTMQVEKIRQENLLLSRRIREYQQRYKPQQDVEPSSVCYRAFISNHSVFSLLINNRHLRLATLTQLMTLLLGL